MAVFAAGQKLRASQLNAISGFTIVRTTNQIRINTTTVADDDTLVFTNLTASATYEMSGFIVVASSTTADFKLGFRCSGTASTLQWGQGGFDAGGTTDDHSAPTLINTAGIGCSGAAAQRFIPLWAYLNTGTGSGISFAVQWAQFALDAVNNTTIFTGSQINLKRVA